MALAKHAEEISEKVFSNLQKMAKKGVNNKQASNFTKEKIQTQKHPGVYPW